MGDQIIWPCGRFRLSELKMKKIVEALLSEIEVSEWLERQGFEALIAGSAVGLDELYEKASTNWYLAATEARDRGLIAGLV